MPEMVALCLRGTNPFLRNGKNGSPHSLATPVTLGTSRYFHHVEIWVKLEIFLDLAEKVRN